MRKYLWFSLAILLLLASCFTRVRAQLVISEVMWAGSARSTADEWLELFVLESGSSTILDASGWQVLSRKSSGEHQPILTFASGTSLATGSFALISNFSADKSDLAIQPDFVTSAVSLPNSKLQLTIRNASGMIIDQVDDAIGKPFAGSNNTKTGIRASMERIDLYGSGTLSTNWQTAMTQIGFDSGALLLGTPKHSLGTGTGLTVTVKDQPDAIEVLTGAVLQITEVLANPVGSDDREWIELANVSSGAVSLNGWTVRDASSQGQFALSGSLAPGEHRRFEKLVTGLSLSNQGEAIRLFSGSLLADTWSYPVAVEGISYGRSGTGFQAFCVPTPDRENIIVPPDYTIEIQSTSGQIHSGTVVGTGTLQLNLELIAQTGSLTKAQCNWEYAGGFTSESCNPPSRTIDQLGTGSITVSVTDYCGTTVQREIFVLVLIEGKAKDQKPKTKAEFGRVRPVIDEPVEQCVPRAFGGVMISEILPNPYGEEKAEEWIELYNEGSESISLCGWQLDDQAGGSKPAPLDDYTVEARGWLLLRRSETGLALNNSGDQARLFAPDPQGGSGVLVQSISYQKSIEGEVYAWRSDGHFVWTPYHTPGAVNQFRSSERRHPHDRLLVTAALPNPVGKDANGEWIEVSNVSDEVIDLTGWQLDNREGGSAPFSLVGLLEPGETQRFLIAETAISLRNSQDVVRVLDPDGYTASVFGWTEAVEGRIYRLPVLHSQPVSARVVNVVDGDTVDVVLTEPDEFDAMPASLKRRWLGLQHRDAPSIRVRLIGIDTPETVHPQVAVQAFGVQASALTKHHLLDQPVKLQFDAEIWDKYDRLLAYVHLPDGNSMQALLLRHGLAYAYLRFPFTKRDEFVAYEHEARLAKLGLWSDDSVIEEIQVVQEDGLHLMLDPPPGLVASGTIVKLQPSVPATIFIASASGVYQANSGSLMISADTHFTAYAERRTESGTVRSTVITGSYILERSHYEPVVQFSEIYPAPQSGEEEWIELYNPSAQPISLAGWTLDDRAETGSRPWVIPGAFTVSASGYLVLTKSDTGLNLNNDGDDVRLVSPDGDLEIFVRYPKVKKGQAVVIMENSRREIRSFVRLRTKLEESKQFSKFESEKFGFVVLRNNQYVSIPSVHPRRKRKLVEAIQEVQTESKVAHDDDQEEIISGPSRHYVLPENELCFSDLASAGLANICYQFAKGTEAKDTDHDGLNDDIEQYLYSTNPLSSDTDQDGFIDGFEVEQKLDPLEPTELSREVNLLYKKFVQESLNIRVKQYKRKGIVVRGKSFPSSVAELIIRNESGAVVLSNKLSIETDWEVAVPPPLPVGQYEITVRLEVSDHEFWFDSLASFELEKPYTKAKKSTKTRSKTDWFSAIYPQKFRYTWPGETHEDSVDKLADSSSLLANLPGQFWSPETVEDRIELQQLSRHFEPIILIGVMLIFIASLPWLTKKRRVSPLPSGGGLGEGRSQPK